MYYTGERTFQDLKRWNPLIGKTFYERNPNNEKEIRTYYMSWNGFANKIKAIPITKQRVIGGIKIFVFDMPTPLITIDSEFFIKVKKANIALKKDVIGNV